jgi:hypothetical protein
MTSTFGKPDEDAGFIENFSADFAIAVLMYDATVGGIIRDLSDDNLSLGYVMKIDEETDMMCVGFPKFGYNKWIKWKNFGHYEQVVT